jgi:CO dehydrogenase maturation factor
MKIAVAGKGGAGKTTIAGTLARIFSDKGSEVIALDSDPSMNLHTSLGLDNPKPVFEYKDLIKERAVVAPGIYSLNPLVRDIPEMCSIRGKNLRLLVMGTVEKAGTGCICPETTFFKSLMRHLVLKRKEVLILDTEAGIEHMGRKVAEGFDMFLVVAEPSIKAVEAANRIGELAKEMGIQEVYCLGNKVMSREDEEFIKEKVKLQFLGFIPYDEAVLRGDRDGKPLADMPSSRAFKAIKKVADRVLEDS